MSSIFFLTYRWVKQNITSMEPFQASIQSICIWGLSQPEKKFLNAYLDWRGLNAIKAHSTSGLPELESRIEASNDKPCLIWEQPSEERIRELLDAGQEILFLGRMTNLQKKIWLKLGVSRIFERVESINQLPIFFSKPNHQSAVFWIYTGSSWMDQILKTMIHSFGHRTINPLESSHLFYQMESEKPDIVILDWDRCIEEDKSFFQRLESFSKSHSLPYFLGMKDYNKQGLSQDLMKWISKFSFVTFPRERLPGALVLSLYSPKKEKPHFQDTDSLIWNKLARSKVQSVHYERIPLPENLANLNDIYENWRWFEWLKDESLFH
ncbi:MAG: hypothetical protein JJT78_16440 [Leptospira sp.]|nr:hypothetical protein [Leptospira sp.]